LTATEIALAQKLNDLCTALLNAPDPEGHGKAIEVVTSALKSVQLERASLETQQSDWQKANTTSESTQYTHVLDVTDLPSESDFHASTEGNSGTRLWYGIWNDLQVMTTLCIDDGLRIPGQSYDGDVLTAAEGIWIRRPRRVRVKLWKGVGHKKECVRVVAADIVDKDCCHEFIAITGGGILGHKEVAYTLGSGGTPTRITANVDSGAGDLAKALAGGPGAISTGLTGAQGIDDGWTKLLDSSSARQIALLQAEKSRLTLEQDIAKLQNPTAPPSAT